MIPTQHYSVRTARPRGVDPGRSLRQRRAWYVEGDITIYNGFKFYLASKILDMSSGGDTLQLTLHTGYTPNIDTHDEWADAGVSSTEYGTASGYTAGGKTLANQSVTNDTANDRTLMDADDVTWTALGALTPATPSHAILWDTTPATTPTDPLVCYIELGTTATDGNDYTISFSTSPSAFISLT